MGLVIQPGASEYSVANMVELVRQDSKKRVNITVLDEDGDAADITESMLASGDSDGELGLDLTNLGGTSVYSESYWPLDAGVTTSTRRIKRSDTGKYYLAIGDTGYEDETSLTGTYLANWHARTDSTVEDVYRTQVIEVVSPRVLSILPHLRLAIDKSWKIVVPSEGCYLGYADSQLVLYLMGGLHYINTFPPYPTFSNLDAFPIEYYSEILVSSAMYVGLRSQYNFAIDTDVPSYNDQGHSFVLQHATPISNYINHLSQDLNARIKNFKMKFLTGGMAATEMRYDLAFSAMLTTAPYGSLFNNLFVSY